MLPFRTSRGARFRCSADFAAGPVLNLNFFDDALLTIPFHLSVRRDEGLIVVNRRDDAGWRREVSFARGFAARAVPVVVAFDAGRVEVRVDGDLIGRFDALPRASREGRFFLRRGFPRLSGIGFVDIEGAVVADSVLIDSAEASPVRMGAGLHLTDAIEVSLEGLDLSEAEGLGQGAARPLLRLDTTGETLPTVIRPLPYALPGRRAGRRAHAVSAVLPGRIWDEAGFALTVTLLDAAGGKLAALTLTRVILAERIDALASAGGLKNDDRAALQVLEHVRHARLFDQLSPQARAGVMQAAERFGLGRYLLDGGDAGAGDAAIAVALDEDRLTALQLRVVAALRAQPDADPVQCLDAALAQSDLPPEDQIVVVLAMTDWFCGLDQIERVAALMHRRGLVPPAFDAGNEAWKLAAALPHHYLVGDFKAVLAALQRLAELRDGWVSTAALGWLAARLAEDAPAASGQPMPEGVRPWMIGALSAAIGARGEDYWERLTCERLTDGVARLVAAQHTLSAGQQTSLQSLALRFWGLVPAFWQRLDAHAAGTGVALPFALIEARENFSELSELIRDGVDTAQARARVDALLGDFGRHFGTDVLRFRRDLLGASGLDLAPGAVPGRQAAMAVGVDPLEAAVRHAADPLAVRDGTPPPAAFRALLRDGVAAAYDTVPAGPFAALQRQVLTRALAVLRAPDPGALAALLRDLAALAVNDAQYLGLGLGVSLVRALSSAGQDDAARQVLDWLERMGGTLTEEWQRGTVAWAPAVTSALQALGRNPASAAHAPRIETALRLAGVRRPPAAPDPRENRTADLWDAANPLLDTLVCLYTCRAYLDTRVAEIRKGWMGMLSDLGIPCLVFVGDGDGRREGDVVHLDAPDTYEGLPQKTLAMVRWVLEHTGFSRLHKIDDDCFLDPAEFHGGLTPVKFDYYGRRLHRARGEMDRTWHMAKSRTVRGRLELDKSPEPSTYADGGTSYVLSRRAMAELVAAADSPAGQDLIAVSFMEDKLVGDLLALRGITVANEDFRVSILRRTSPGGPIVPLWDNGFLPFAGSGIKLAHLDCAEEQAPVMAGLSQPWPRGAKVWPTYQNARFGWCSNALDLISPRDKLIRVNEAEVAVIACLRNEALMLPRFLDHYRALGVRGFLIADNGSSDGSFEMLADQPDVALFSVDTDYGRSTYGVAWQQALMANFRTGRWSLMADADEFLFWRSDLAGSLPQAVAGFDAEGADAARIFMLDMYPQGSLGSVDLVDVGPFRQAPFVERAPFLQVPGATGAYANSPVWTSALRHRLIPGSRAELFVAQKYALLKYRPWMRMTAGLHFLTGGTLASQDMLFGHFKYNAAFRAKAQAEVQRRQHFNGAEEYRKYLALVSEGRDVVYAPGTSVRWDDCEFVRARLWDR